MPNGSERYYSAEITEDLFNTVVFCTWGTKGTKLGGTKTHPVENPKQAEIKILDILKQREKRGYLLSDD